MKVGTMADRQGVSFKETLNLPRTDFPIKANQAEVQAVMLKRWAADDLYKKTFVANEGADSYIVHDGPPYPNGPIHLGHAYNKILKDIVAKSWRMAGKHVPVTPGWDCHGLPIEIKVAQEHPGVARAEMIALCRSYANQWIDVQREQFKQLGVLMDWDRPYLTMNYAYEAAILEAFAKFVAGGFAERNFKTIPWCATCKTALAAAEIEYKDRKDPSLYIWFGFDEPTTKRLFASLDKPIGVIIWTTTPWTLALNRAVAIKPETTYDVLALADGRYGLVAHALRSKVANLLSVPDQAVMSVKSDDLAKAQVQHPIVDQRFVPVIMDQDVSLQDGTACVHCAPGCGPEDYALALKNNLEIYSPLSAAGIYTAGIEPAELEGMSIADGQGWAIKQLQVTGRLLHKASIIHSYPHCWRCRNGLMFRATKQWFLSLSKASLREKALLALDSMTFLPDASKNHLRAALESRLEWCISRQRVWGVPIPALLCTQCDEAFIDQLLLARVIEGVRAQGVEFWHTASVSELTHNAKCAKCGSASFKKEDNILDVWFDSGISHFAVLTHNQQLRFPADMYCEGRDQARGWFQSSLLTSMVLEEQPCTRTILTHGYTVDEKGQKMSKSIGNVIAPQEIMDEFGVEVLRLWVSSIDYADDAVISRPLLSNVLEVYRKIRNTARFLLANLYDFDSSRDIVPVEQLLPLDQYALRQLFLFDARVRSAYEQSDFTAVYHAFTDYCTTELSALYLDIIKDRLYVERASGKPRRSAQTVCWHILDTLTRLMAPVLSFTAEQLADFYQGVSHESIHLQKFVAVSDVIEIVRTSSHNANLLNTIKNPGRQIERVTFALAWESGWAELLAIRTCILKAIEEQRAQGIIKHSLESHVTLHLDQPLRDRLVVVLAHIEASGQPFADFMRELCIVSQVTIAADKDALKETAVEGLLVTAQRAQGAKCPRCWQYDTQPAEQDLCPRCFAIVGKK